MYRIENIIFLENQHAQGLTCIPIIGSTDPNYGIKGINYTPIGYHELFVNFSLRRSEAFLVPVRRSKHKVLYTKSKGI